MESAYALYVHNKPRVFFLGRYQSVNVIDTKSLMIQILFLGEKKKQI